MEGEQPAAPAKKPAPPAKPAAAAKGKARESSGSDESSEEESSSEEDDSEEVGKLPGGGGKRPAKGKVSSNESIRKKEQSMVSEVSFEELSILQERLDQKEKEMGEHKERERSLAVKLEQSQVEKQTVENELSKIVGEQEVIKANLQEERGRVRQLEGTKEQLQHKVKEVAQLKAKNAMDLLDFRVRIVGDSTLDDLDQMEEMQQKIEEQ